MTDGTSALVKIAVFYDGSYFQQVTNHYRYTHDIRRRIDLGGLHDFIRWRVAKLEDYPKSMCRIVEAHYYRGRFTLADIDEKANRDGNPGFVEEFLRGERVFDQLMAQHHITPHYLRVDTSRDYPRERGVEVALALDAYDLAVTRRLDWVALMTPDADYVPLVRRLALVGTRVLLLAFEFPGKTVVSKALIAEATDVVPMHQVAEQGMPGFDPQTLFVAD
ncbi:MAG: NYN domain-containing protein [Sphingomonadaceae bacterium]|uniref:NYN domain-containing protein n=1 Tax=Thermaurantiacus sp. TaxID=2820283 RepID=UPI00298F07D6|nr:NYN domain-containing protein [Thermaurantiacus sp.]MCS6986617.1 NYN domain-containing protein [Sphingomonadaceae bacterium]MDW8414122.1 NYN domain-containing protein [Thermaurantiacus sp.]